MHRFLMLIVIYLLSLPSPSAAQSPPGQLRGKSVIVSWSEGRLQRSPGGPRAGMLRRGGSGEFASVQVSHELRMYVSTAGRVFSRFGASSQPGTGSRDEVGGSSVHPTFGNQSMTVFIGEMKGPNSGVRRIAISFDGNFAGCSAQVVRAKQQGASHIDSSSVITGQQLEIRSVIVSGVSCATQPGNVFGGE